MKTQIMMTKLSIVGQFIRIHTLVMSASKVMTESWDAMFAYSKTTSRVSKASIRSPIKPRLLAQVARN